MGSSWSLEKKKETRCTANISMCNTDHHKKKKNLPAGLSFSVSAHTLMKCRRKTACTFENTVSLLSCSDNLDLFSESTEQRPASTPTQWLTSQTLSPIIPSKTVLFRFSYLGINARRCRGSAETSQRQNINTLLMLSGEFCGNVIQNLAQKKIE